MYTAVSGIFENGTLKLTETPATLEKSDVVVLFLDKSETNKKQKKGVKLGSLAGKYSIPDNFNEPLEDLKDYM